ncbi:MAG: endonuclease III [Desulfuromonadales bacterium]|nr:endonuclease III [Desulfuromonadales bacterium]
MKSPALTRAPTTLLDRLAEVYPAAECSLAHRSPFELLIATILSAQCTDRRVNLVTPSLFTRYPDTANLSQAELSEVEELIRSTGFYHAKARHLIGCAQGLMQHHHGKVPATLRELISLPGVGRKTANVILGTAFQIPAMVVDTHVSRLAQRFGWTTARDPDRIETELAELLPRRYWITTSHLLIAHGRAFCKAPTPDCSTCPIFALCPRQGVTKSR